MRNFPSSPPSYLPSAPLFPPSFDPSSALTPPLSSQKRVGYADFLRCLAAFTVVVLHCTGPWVGGALAVESKQWLACNILSALTRWAVPMFVILSGAFLLDPAKPLSRKGLATHIARVGVATLFWGLFYCLYEKRSMGLSLGWLAAGAKALWNSELHYHLWFTPMLLGLYIFLPLMRAFVKGASRPTLWYAAGLWTVFKVTLPALYRLFPALPGLSWWIRFEHWNVLGYAGWFLLGYLLRTCAVKPLWEKLLYAAGVLGAAMTPIGTALLSIPAGYLQSEFYGNCSITVLPMTAALFLFARQHDLGKSEVWKRLSPLTFGVYLLHPLVLDRVRAMGLDRISFSLAAIGAWVITVVPISFLLAWLVRKLPKVGKWIT